MDAAKAIRRVGPEHVAVPLRATTRDAAVRELAGLFAASGALKKGKSEALALEVLQREGEGTTGIGGGVAVPHAKTTLVDGLLVAAGLSDKGIDFAAVDGDPVHVVFLIASAPSAAADHLALMKWVVTLTRSRYWMKLVRGCTTPEALVEVLEESQSGGGGR
jgi:mannitol/fructose-specific phosphotransferase system IIA component (Ntr-type)